MPTSPPKKLLILLGSGSSVSHGLPSVSDLDTLLLEHARANSRRPAFPPDYFKYLWDNRLAYYSEEKPEHRPPLNFEVVLGDLFALINQLRERPYGSPMRWLLARDNAPEGFRLPVTYPGIDYNRWAFVQEQTAGLLSLLARHMRERTRIANLSTPKFRDYRSLFARLAEFFDIGVYNLNYDNLALMAFPGAFVGFDRQSGKFSPSAVHGRKEWHFVYHLHGSVHHSLPIHRTGPPEWRDDLGRSDFDDGGTNRTDHRGTEDQQFPQTSLVAGGWKVEQLQKEPYHSFYAALVRHLSEADAILIGGYGFGDEHIGNALQNRIENGRRIPVMVLDRAELDRGAESLESRHDWWSDHLRKSLSCWGGFREAGKLTSSPPLMADLVARKAFEVSTVPERSVASWYGGFSEAACRVGDIAAWLTGNEEALAAHEPKVTD